MRDRLAFDALSESEALSRWNSYSPSMRSRLGLDTGYYGHRFGGGLYDPAYSAFGYQSSLGRSSPQVFALLARCYYFIS